MYSSVVDVSWDHFSNTVISKTGYSLQETMKGYQEGLKMDGLLLFQHSEGLLMRSSALQFISTSLLDLDFILILLVLQSSL